MLLFGFSDKKTLSIDPLGIVPDERTRSKCLGFEDSNEIHHEEILKSRILLKFGSI